MPSLRLRYILAAALLIAWGIFAGLGAHHAHQGVQQDQVSHQQDQEAQSHAQAAQAIPDHAAELARLAQEAATNAWKQAVKESRWRGRIEGFAAGAVLGYVGGKL